MWFHINAACLPLLFNFLLQWSEYSAAIDCRRCCCCTTLHRSEAPQAGDCCVEEK
jgi:hypothetical protein